MYDILELNKKLVSELRQIAKDLNVKKADSLRKQDLVYKILDQQAINATEESEPVKKERQSKNRFEYLYQVSAFKDIKRAEDLQSKLVQAGISASVTKAYAGSQQWYRVFVNFKGTESQAREIKKELRLLGIDKPFLKSKKPSTDY